MVFCCLIMAYEEEFFYWSRKSLNSVASPEKTSITSSYEVDRETHYNETESCFLPDRLLRLMDIFISGIVIILFGIFNLMLIMTTLYFHTPIEKVLGVAMGVFGYNLISFKYPWDCLSKIQAS